MDITAKCRDNYTCMFEPEEIPNCGYARHAYAVQSRIPAIKKFRNWKTISGDLGMKATLLFIENQKRLEHGRSRPKHKYRIVVKTTSASVVYED